VSLVKLLNDIKLLLIGIESESFKRAEDTLKFYATMNSSCEDISDLSHFLDAFLEAGTCFKRLKTYTSKSPFNQCHLFDGFLFKAFCDRIVRFLNHSRDLIYSQEAESFLELHENTKKLRNIITHVAKFLNIHPSCSVNQVSIPTGSEFLKLLYDEYTKVFNSDLKCFYIELLKSCCEVYYLRYQQWFYHGQLDDQHKELFIVYSDHYSENTKLFFDKAYLIRKHSVPGFLQGCAENVLLCGKYTMLLRFFKPMVRMIFGVRLKILIF
jgi:gamma-tubulin complex component 6